MFRPIFLAVSVCFCLGAKQLVAAEIIPLAGEWRFALDRNDVGSKANTGSPKICRTKSGCPAFFRRRATAMTSARTRRGC